MDHIEYLNKLHLLLDYELEQQMRELEKIAAEQDRIEKFFA